MKQSHLDVIRVMVARYSLAVVRKYIEDRLAQINPEADMDQSFRDILDGIIIMNGADAMRSAIDIISEPVVPDTRPLTVQIRSIMRKHGRKRIWTNKNKSTRSIKCYQGGDPQDTLWLCNELKELLDPLEIDYKIKQTMGPIDIVFKGAIIVTIPQ